MPYLHHASRISATFRAMVSSSSRACALRVSSSSFSVFELFLEVLVADGFARGDTDVAAGVERPALGFDFFERGGFAEAGNIRYFRFALTPALFRFRGRGRKTSTSFALASSPPRVKSSSSPR